MPPVTIALAEPLGNPQVDGEVVNVTLTAVGCVMVTVRVVEQLFASVTVSV